MVKKRSILVVCNNHNSINILRFCEKIIKFYSMDVVAICHSENLAFKYSKLFNIKDMHFFVFKPELIYKFEKDIYLKKLPQNDIKNKENKYFQNSIYKLLSFSSLYFLLREYLIRKKLMIAHITVCKFFEENNFHSVLSMSDRTHDYCEAATLKVAKEKNVKIILPFIADFDPDGAMVYRLDKNNKILDEFNPFKPFNLYKFLMYKKFKNQIHKRAFFQPPFILNAHYKNGSLSKYPWWVGSGNSDIIFVENELSYKKYIKHQTPEHKLKVIGQIQYDDVYKSYRNKNKIKRDIMFEYGFDESKRLVILSMPQHGEQGFINMKNHLQNIHTILEEIKKTNVNLLVSLHPRQNLDDYNFIQESYSCKISNQPLSKIISCADLFIASNSTTLTWAVLCGVESINLLSPTPNLFKKIKSIKYVKNYKDLSHEIENSFNHPFEDYKEDWNNLSRDIVFKDNFNERFARYLFDF